VVGVTADFLQGSLTAPPAGVIVNLANQLGGIQPAFVLRSASAAPMAGVVRELVSDVLPGATRVEISTGRDLVMRDLGRQRLGALFFSGFGLVTLALGAGGVFGLVAYLAESRRREFGVRLALGATPGALVRGGVTAGLVPVLLGVGGGLLAAATVARAFVSVLPGLSPLDPVTFVSVALLMIACAALAGLAAAWRLRGIAPVDALRAE
jgi:ABC-type antimicrobial peptide transport system permease subunit